MGDIFDKLEFTLNAVKDITKALKEVSYENIDELNLAEYADAIKRLSTISGNDTISTFNMISKYGYSNALLRLESDYIEPKWSPNVITVNTFVNIYPNHLKNQECTEVTI